MVWLACLGGLATTKSAPRQYDDRDRRRAECWAWRMALLRGSDKRPNRHGIPSTLMTETSRLGTGFKHWRERQQP